MMGGIKLDPLKRPTVTVWREGATEIIQLGRPRPHVVEDTPGERLLIGYGDPVRVGDRVNIYSRRDGQRYRQVDSYNQNVLLTHFGPPDKPELSWQTSDARCGGLYHGAGWRKEFELLTPREPWWLDLERGERVRLVRTVPGHRPELRAFTGRVGVAWDREPKDGGHCYWVQFMQDTMPLLVSCRYLEIASQKTVPAPLGEGA